MLSRLVEKDDVAVRVAEARLAPHPRLVARAVLERNSAARQLLDSFVEIVALQVDGRGRDDLLVRVDLDRESDAAGGLESRIAGVRAVDDLHEPDPAIEID